MTAMNYNEPQTETYTFPNLAFGNNTATFNLIGPKGRRGLVKDIIVDISLGMVGTSSVPEIDVGTASGDVSYAQYRLGTSPILGYTSTSTPKRATQEAITGNPPPALNDFPGHVALEKAFIPRDTAFVVTLKAGTGGVPAGAATVYLVVDWF